MTGQRHCQNCRFWELLKDGDESGGVFADGNYTVEDGGTGRCRRFPPSASRAPLPLGAHSSDAAGMAYWPVTWDKDWCGGFSARGWAE